MPPGDTDPLLPLHEDRNTARDARLHRKLHTYHMIRALSDGYMPSTEQAIANLRALLASDVLSQHNQDISRVGRQLIQDSRLWIQNFIDLLRDKNSQDQLQDFLWRISQQSQGSLDTSRIPQQVFQVGAAADSKAGTVFLSSSYIFAYGFNC